MATTPYPFVSGTVLTASQLNSTFNIPTTTKTASYTLTAADAGTRIYMNSASATTITVNTSIFEASDIVEIVNIGSGATTITAGTATVSTSSSLALVEFGGGKLVFTSASASIFFLAGSGSAYGTATGGIGSPTAVTINSVDYQYLQFNATGTLTVTKAGFFDYCLIGGGNGSIYWSQSTLANAPGGSGAVVIGSVYLSANCTITIGAGAAIQILNNNTNKASTTSLGAPSPFAINSAGSSGIVFFDTDFRGQSWGRTGGGFGSINGATSNSITNDYGFLGGNSTATTNAGGGGGNTAVGSNGSSTTGGAGGAGFDVSAFIGGSALFKATGGGGGGSVTGGAGGSTNACTNNGTATTTPQSAAANTGAGGGGGNGTAQTTGAGGSGIAYIRFEV